MEFVAGVKASEHDASMAALCRDAYDRTLARYHPWLVRKGAALAMYTLPTRKQVRSMICFISNLFSPLTFFQLIMTLVSSEGSLPSDRQIAKHLSDLIESCRGAYDHVQNIYGTYGILELP